MRGRRVGSRVRFQRLWKSFQATWKAMKVLPVPVASVSRMRCLLVGDRLHDALDGDVLVVARRVRAALVLEGHGGEAVAPGVLLGEGERPELVGRGIGRQLALRAGVHVDAVDALAVGRVGEAHGHLAGVVLGLGDALGERLVPRLGLDHGQLAVAVDEDVVGGERLAAVAVALDAARRDRVLAQDAAALDDAPAGRLERGVDVLGSGLGFVHASASPVGR